MIEYAYELDSLIQKVKTSGIYVRDLKHNDTIELIVEGGQKITLFVCDPAAGSVGITSTGQWKIFIHLAHYWGCSVAVGSMLMNRHWICKGCPLFFGIIITPPIQRIILNGFDLTNPSDTQKN